MKSQDQEVLVIGGGIIGLCTAWYLGEAGYRVTVIDRDVARKESCTDGNAGMVVPSHFTPLAAPGVISQGLRWMLDRTSPFYLRPRLDPALWSWCWKFLRHANRRHVENSRELLRDLSLASREEFVRLSEKLKFPLEQRGLLMLCQTEEGLEEESQMAREAWELDLEAEICSPERIQELDPAMKAEVIGGVWFPHDCHLDPVRMLQGLREGIRQQGGEIREEEVQDLTVESDAVQEVHLKGESLAADTVILAGGAWSPLLSQRLGLKLPMQAGKGYSLTLKSPARKPGLCSLLKEGHVAVTPMGDTLRVAGTMEICGRDLSVDQMRVDGIVKTFCRYFPDFQPEDFANLDVWSGLRPCTPDGLPYLGRVPYVNNAWIASGHAMVGLSLAPITGKLMAEAITGSGELDSRVAPERFG